MNAVVSKAKQQVLSFKKRKKDQRQRQGQSKNSSSWSYFKRDEGCVAVESTEPWQRECGSNFQFFQQSSVQRESYSASSSRVESSLVSSNVGCSWKSRKRQRQRAWRQNQRSRKPSGVEQARMGLLALMRGASLEDWCFFSWL